MFDFQIHHDIAKYHDLGRFVHEESEIDYKAAMYHERQAADLGVMEAVLTMARLYLGMQRDILCNYQLEVSNCMPLRSTLSRVATMSGIQE